MSWQLQIQRWRKQYRVPARKPSTTNLTRLALRICKKCESKKDVHRHHKGNEYFFAVKWPGRYAERYVRFRRKDTVDLCSNCHEHIHVLYLPITYELLEEFEKKGKMTRFRCDYYISRFTDECSTWLRGRKSDKNTKREGRLRSSV